MKALKVFSVLVFTVIISVLSHCSILNAQTGWVLQPSSSNVNYIKVKFINSVTGFILGDDRILKTTNTGSSWSEYIIGDSINEMRDITFINQTGFAAGGALWLYTGGLYATSLVLKTTDAGSTWFKVFSDTGQAVQKHLSTVCFVDENTGFVSGGLYGFGENYLYKTTDAGSTWNEISFGTNQYPFAIDFTDNSNGVSVMFGRILKTSNGGVNWSGVVQNDFLSGLHFVNALTGYASGGVPIYNGSGTSVIYKTTNGGNNWNNIFDRTSDKFSLLNAIYFPDVNTGYSVGSSLSAFPDSLSIIMKTTNAGTSWGFQTSPTDDPLLSVYFINNDLGFAVGCNGRILKTTDGGGEITSGINTVSGSVPEGYNLYQNYPNPFNPSTVIKFALPEKQFVSLKVFDNLGKEVGTLVNEIVNQGVHEFKWDAGTLPGGVYFYRIKTDNYLNSGKMILLK